MRTSGPAGTDFRKKEVMLSSGPVTYHEAGEGPPILYFHSAGGIRFTYGLDQLAKSYKIHMMVAPGFDETPVHPKVTSMRELACLAGEFADEIIGQPCDVIGQSFGGYLSAWFAVENPQRLGFLIVQCPSGFRPAELPRQPAANPEEMISRMFAHPERIPPGEKSSAQLADGRKWADYYHKSIGFDGELAGRLDEIECQTLILQGTKDGMMPPECAQFLAKSIKLGKLVYVFDAGHNIEVDQPKRFVDLVQDFLTRGEAFIVNPGDELAGLGQTGRR